MELSQAMITGQGVHIGEAMSEGLKVTGLGLTIVFAVLVILMIVLYLFKVIFYKDPSKQAKPADSAPAEAPAPVQTAAPEEDGMDEEELIAVLTAAVAASLNTSTYNLKIKSYRRVNNNTPSWNKAGVNETINNRLY